MRDDCAASGAGCDVDVLIIGAGLSGVGMACHLNTRLPSLTYLVVESRAAIGGTWDLFRYPGVRSDSDMFTLGYSFRPWPYTSSIADGQSILDYIRDTAEAYGVGDHIRFNTKVVAADWSSSDSYWTVTLASVTGHTTMTCRFIYAATGYYDYETGYSPEFEGREQFEGLIVHPQFWPQQLAYDDAQIVVIGSGATAVTLVPALAERAAHVTMLQRTPTYIAALPRRDRLAAALSRMLPSDRAHQVIRSKHIASSMLSYQVARRAPKVMRSLLRSGAKSHLPDGYPVNEHFTPPYEPWDQRLCLAPDGDFYAAIAAGRADVITDTIDAFTSTGIRLVSGREIPADIIVTATGLNLLVLGGMTMSLDGREVVASESIGYRGAMLCGIPNFAVALGYINASWTLKCDLISEFVCRVIAHMVANGHSVVTPRFPPSDLPTRPFMDLDAGYVRRSVEQLPRQVDAEPWRGHQNYLRDRLAFSRANLSDGSLLFG
jgi:cation diffusion facilitator CzcD-associated flavoprotein CzcO